MQPKVMKFIISGVFAARLAAQLILSAIKSARNALLETLVCSTKRRRKCGHIRRPVDEQQQHETSTSHTFIRSILVLAQMHHCTRFRLRCNEAVPWYMVCAMVLVLQYIVQLQLFQIILDQDRWSSSLLANLMHFSFSWKHLWLPLSPSC